MHISQDTLAFVAILVVVIGLQRLMRSRQR